MDRYQRVRKIGEGAFGKAVLVRHKQTNKQCVVKEINIVKMPPKEREDARKEVAVLAQLKHPNIVSYIESFEEAGTLYIVMNYCSGGDLYGRINNQHGRLFTEDQILNWFVQICLAIKHIHDRKILHRDIKSQNIFLNSAGIVQLGDFGIAKVLNNTMELARTCIGTPYYLSPEIVENKSYNNKSDIWSLGCVLYELTTLKHAFEAGNMKNLVLKIIRGSYPPIAPQYSYDLRGLVAQLFKRAPRDRPSINAVLKKPFIMDRVHKLMSAEQIEDEFSHTVMHGAKLAKALPPAPRPSSAPKKSSVSRPRSAGRGRYDPASVYGAPLGRKSQNRSSGDLKKKGGGVGNRPLPIPGQQEWEQKKKDPVDREKKSGEENKKKFEDQCARRHQNLVEKQKMDRMNKAREEGWKNLLGSSDDKSEARPQTPHNAGDARPLPAPRQKPSAQPNAREPGNYDDYIAYLEKLKADKQEQERALNKKAEYMVAPPPLSNDPNAPPAVQAAQAINQANYDRQKAAEAAERAKITEEYLQRRQAAAANKARGRADLLGNRPPSGGKGRALPTPKPAAAKPNSAKQGRNKEEQEYLENLRKIREQNMRDRRNMLQKRAGIPQSHPDAEERRKKAEGLKKQAEVWAQKKKEQLEKDRQELLRQQQDKLKQQQQAGANVNRPGSVKPSMTPAPAVPISGMLHLIGAGKQAVPPSAGQEQATPAEDEKSVQQKKSDILKRLNEKPPAKQQWGAAGKEELTPATEGEGEGEVQMRRAWGEGGVAPLADPQSARSQWGDDPMRLSNLPLEQTGSAMEATSARDRVVLNPGELENPKSSRNQWGRPGSTVVRALNQLPVCEGTISLNSTDEGTMEENPTHPPDAKAVAIGSTITLSKPTITLSKPPIPPPASQYSAPHSFPSPPPPAPTPSIKPAIQSGTVVLKATADSSSPSSVSATTAAAAAAGATITIAKEDVGVAGDAAEPTITTPLSSPDATRALVGETELPGSNHFIQANQQQAEGENDRHRLSTVFEVSFVESETCRTARGKNEAADSESLSKPGGKNDIGHGGDDRVAGKLEVKPKPELKCKPAVAQKPVLLPKPQLLSKPDLPYHFSEQAPEVVSGADDDQTVFSKVPEKLGSGRTEESQQAESVRLGLTTGNFDMKNVQLLRTCSEPDLASLFRSSVQAVRATVRRHQSLDLSQEVDTEEQDEEKLSVRSLSPGEGAEQSSGSAEQGDEDSSKDRNEMGDDNVADEEDEDLISMRETMRSLLLEDGDEEGALSPKIKFSLSSDAESTLRDDDDDDELMKQYQKLQKDDDSNDNDDDNNNADEELASKTVCAVGVKGKSKSDSVLSRKENKMEEEEEEEKGAEGGEDVYDDGDNEGNDGEEEEDDEGSQQLKYSTADIMTLNDSDDETEFGDEDEDLDVFSRLEQQRVELERELGCDKFIEIYKTVQALQEDEDENMEEGARIAIGLLGHDKQHLYPKIFQLVMAETAFTEDNA